MFIARVQEDNVGLAMEAVFELVSDIIEMVIVKGVNAIVLLSRPLCYKAHVFVVFTILVSIDNLLSDLIPEIVVFEPWLLILARVRHLNLLYNSKSLIFKRSSDANHPCITVELHNILLEEEVLHPLL